MVVSTFKQIKKTPFSPMHASSIVDTSTLKDIRFPIYASTIISGIPIYIRSGTICDFTGEEIKNMYMYVVFKDIIELSECYNITFQGVLACNPVPNAPAPLPLIDMLALTEKEDSYQLISDTVKFYCYDIVEEDSTNPTYRHRLIKLEKMLTGINRTVLVKQNELKDFKALELFFQSSLFRGFEGIVIKEINGVYRSTTNLSNIKLKPDFQYASIIEDIVSDMIIEDEPHLNSEKKITEIASKIITRINDTVFSISLEGNDIHFRKHLWDFRLKYKGKSFIYEGIIFSDCKIPKYTKFLTPII
jgi:hypothetical protein